MIVTERVVMWATAPVCRDVQAQQVCHDAAQSDKQVDDTLVDQGVPSCAATHEAPNRLSPQRCENP